MRSIVFLAALSALSLACEDPAEPRTSGEAETQLTAPESAGGEKVAMAGKIPGGPGGRSALSGAFPEVEVETKSSFAHDRGMMTSLESVKIKGAVWEDRYETLAGIVAARGGWSPSGGGSDADILATAEAFVRAWASMLGEDMLTDAEAPKDLTEAPGRAKARFPSYHPPKTALYELSDGERIVAVSYFERGYVGMRGRNWHFRVSAFRVKDGKRYTLRYEGDTDAAVGAQPVDPLIPRPTSFSERG